MESYTDSRVESDKRGIVELEIEEDESSSTSSKFRTSCFSFCANKYIAIPIVMSTIALFLALGTMFGVAVRWSQMNTEIKRLQVVIDALEIQQTASSAIAQVQVQQSHKSGGEGSTYIHWGKKTCGADSKLIYSGFGAGSAAGTSSRGGGGADYLCMPTNPEYNKFDMSNDTAAHSWVYSTEYMSFNMGIFSDRIHGHNVACSVCHSPRTAKTMIPARRNCPVGWTREYEGYLMSSYVTDMKMTYQCVDAEPDIISGTQNVTGGSGLYFVSGFCGLWGGLSHCPPYVTARELSCTLCTK